MSAKSEYEPQKVEVKIPDEISSLPESVNHVFNIAIVIGILLAFLMVMNLARWYLNRKRKKKCKVVPKAKAPIFVTKSSGTISSPPAEDVFEKPIDIGDTGFEASHKKRPSNVKTIAIAIEKTDSESVERKKRKILAATHFVDRMELKKPPTYHGIKTPVGKMIKSPNSSAETIPKSDKIMKSPNSSAETIPKSDKATDTTPRQPNVSDTMSAEPNPRSPLPPLVRTPIPPEKEKERVPPPPPQSPFAAGSPINKAVAEVAYANTVEAWIRNVLNRGVEPLLADFREVFDWKDPTTTLVANEANLQKNRYSNIPCHDNRRFILRWPGLSSDYIHANYISSPNNERRFICTQGPLEHTQHAFWAMALQSGCENIIMLCQTVEGGKKKCFQYWPNERGESIVLGPGEDGRIRVTNIYVQSICNMEVRLCRLRCDWKDGTHWRSQIITHYQWEGWPDIGIPPHNLTAATLLSFVRNTSNPVIIHCSAGIGRTGTLVAISISLERMRSGISCIDMLNLVKDLRSQRAYSIQTEQQYLYLHRELLAYFLDKHRPGVNRFLREEGAKKYKKWCEDYKKITGHD